MNNTNSSIVSPINTPLPKKKKIYKKYYGKKKSKIEQPVTPSIVVSIDALQQEIIELKKQLVSIQKENDEIYIENLRILQENHDLRHN